MPKAKKRQRRLTLPKKPRKNKPKRGLDELFGSEDEGGPNHVRKPTATEWERMTEGIMFVPDGVEWRRGDEYVCLPYQSTCAQLDLASSVILHSAEGDENPWVARIISIRKRDPEDCRDVWVLVRWYYSAQDLQAVKLCNL